MSLSDAQLRKLKPKEKTYKIADRDGLYAYIYTNGKVYWRFRWHHAGKDKAISLGSYPETNLAQAREKCMHLRSAMQNGQDPALVLNPEAEIKPTFEEVARDWLRRKEPSWSPKHAHKIMQRLENRLFPVFGAVTIAELKPADVLPPIRESEARGQCEIAHRLAEYVNNVADFAVISGIMEYNPFARLTKIMQPVKVKHYPAILDPKRIGELLCRIDDSRSRFVTKMCLKLLPYVFLRSSEIRGARWDEIDFDTATWTIPAARMKMKRPHIVPLSRQTVILLQELREGVSTELCFPGTRSNTRTCHTASLHSYATP